MGPNEFCESHEKLSNSVATLKAQMSFVIFMCTAILTGVIAMLFKVFGGG